MSRTISGSCASNCWRNRSAVTFTIPSSLRRLAHRRFRTRSTEAARRSRRFLAALLFVRRRTQAVSDRTAGVGSNRSRDRAVNRIVGSSCSISRPPRTGNHKNKRGFCSNSVNCKNTYVFRIGDRLCYEFCLFSRPIQH